MTTEEAGRKFFTLLIGLATFLILSSFVVSFNIIHFIYLVVLYIYIYRIRKAIKEGNLDEDD